MARKKSPNTFALLARLPKQISHVASTELANAKAEVSGRIKNLVIAIVLFVVALVFLFWTTAVLLTAAIAGLGTVLPIWAAALIIGGAGLLVILLCVIIGIVLAKKGNPVPTETIARVKADFSAAGEIKKSTDQLKPQPGVKGTKQGEAGVWK